MSLWEEIYLPSYKEFVEDIIDWNPDYIVPVARKSCKLFHAVDDLFQQVKRIIYYRDYFELFSSDVIVNKKIAVVDDAAHHASTLREYRDFFEKEKAIVQTFAFIGHQRLKQSKNENYDSKAIIKNYLSEAAYQEYLLLQSSYLIMNGAHQDLDHLVVEIDTEDAKPELIDRLITLLRTFGYVYELPPEYEGTAKRFGIHQPDFFVIENFLPDDSVRGDFVQKIKFSFLHKKKQLLCALMVFPKMLPNAFCPWGKSLKFQLPFDLPCQKFLGLCKERKINKLCYQFTSLILSTILGKQFIQTLKRVDAQMLDLFNTFEIKKGDLVRYLGEEIGIYLVDKISNFIKNHESTNNFALTPTNGSISHDSIVPESSLSYKNVPLLLERLRKGYEEEVKRKGRVGVHYTLSVEDLLATNSGIYPLVLTEILDEKCDVGILVPMTEEKNGWWRRTYRTGEPTELQWKRTTYLIPWVIHIFSEKSAQLERDYIDLWM
jgi:hypothetical protein